MSGIIDSFHFLRPAWLFALFLLAPLIVFAWRRQGFMNDWRRICDPHLLRHLVSDHAGARTRWPIALLGLGWIAACVAIAGPTWERLPQSSFKNPARSVLVLGLSPTMNARDVAPSRIARARYKLQDAVELLKDGSIGLVLYREEAFTAMPLTDDAQVLRELLPLIKTDLAPGQAVLPARGLAEARRILEPVGLNGARILLVSDGADDDPEATVREAAALERAGVQVSVLGISQASAGLERTAQAGGGRFAELRADDGDLDKLLVGEDVALGTQLNRTNVQTDTWRDMGVWLVWIPLLLAPIAFRKGWAAALLTLLFIQLPISPAEAGVRDWFERADQQAAQSYAEKDFKVAADAFEDPSWKAAANYRAGNFEQAADLLTEDSDPESRYNLGNAFAKSGRLKEAISAYDQALAVNPENADAQFNRKLVKDLLDAQTPPPESTPDDSSEDASEQNDSGSQHGSSGDSPQPQQDSSGGDENTSDDATQNDSASSPPDHNAPTSAADEDQDLGKDTPASPSPTRPGASDESSTADSSQQISPSAGAAETESADSMGETEDAKASAADKSSIGPPGEAGETKIASEPAEPTENDSADDATRSMPGAPTGASPKNQWMARLPDDPGGLLREKMRRDYIRRLETRRNGGG